MENRCIFCGEILPEGKMICADCESRYDPESTRYALDDISASERIHKTNTYDFYRLEY
nr:hypothetical protein DGKKSRWO_DGKKSRWO_CDS_0077 [uncultured phage]CAI9752247.1 hypothetical protein CVNMHQAP_CVNMHQAP_CDS_0077 [uncultured phage]